MIAIYNPASKSRTWQVGADARPAARAPLPRHRRRVGRDVGGAEEAVTVTTLAELDPAQVDMRTCLLIIGSSMTRVEGLRGSSRLGGTTRVALDDRDAFRWGGGCGWR